MSTKMKWAEHHNHEADHAAAKVAHHKLRKESHLAHAALHDGLHKTTGMLVHKNFADQHRSDAAVHDAEATRYSSEETYHRGESEKCSKAIEADFQKRQTDVPPGFSLVTPDNPARPGIKAITRPGQRPLPTSADKPNVPLEFQKLFTVEDEEERIA